MGRGGSELLPGGGGGTEARVSLQLSSRLRLQAHLARGALLPSVTLQYSSEGGGGGATVGGPEAAAEVAVSGGPTADVVGHELPVLQQPPAPAAAAQQQPQLDQHQNQQQQAEPEEAQEKAYNDEGQ
jgi:hypothetical protein